MTQINIFSARFIGETSKKYLLYLFVTVTFLVYGFLFSTAYASTNISDDITEDITWSMDGSPYVIDNSIMVAEEATLTIDSGVVVKFDPEVGKSYIYVLGDIIANGTKGSPIYFTSNYDDEVGGSTDEDYEDCYYEGYDENDNPIGDEICEVVDWSDPSIGDWGGLYFIFSSFSHFENVFFKYAVDTISTESSNISFENLNISDSTSGIIASDDSHIDIGSGMFSNLDKNGIEIFSNSSISIEDFTLDGQGIDVFDNSSINLNKTSIQNTYNGVDVYLDSSAIINNSNISCEYNGIEVYLNSSLSLNGDNLSCMNDGINIFSESSADIQNTKITNAMYAGILAFGNSELSKINITKSEITNNNFGFLVFNSNISVSESSIHDNFTYGALTFSTESNPIPINLDFTSNYWGDPSGPMHTSNPLGIGDGVSDNILFSPFLKTDPLKEKPRNPVILIPGMTGTYLYKDYDDKGEIWPDAWNTIFSIPDILLKDLTLNKDGTENSEKPIKVGDIIRNIDSIGIHVFDGLISEFTDVGYKEGTDLFVFPYDWRLNTKYTAGLLNEKINKVLLDTGDEKVDIVAHSMGGLVAKKYIADYGENKIDQLIFLGTPQLGSPKAFKALMFGDSMGFEKFSVSLLRLSVTKYISQNMPSVYELLPSSKYIEDNGNYVTNATNEIIIPGSSLSLNYTETKNLMIDKGRNTLMFPFAEELHYSIDNMDLSGIKSYNFVGCGSKTIGEIAVTQKRAWEKLFLGLKDDYNLKYVNGDETVPLASAEKTIGSELYFVKDTAHGSLPSADGVKQDILSIISGGSMGNYDNILIDSSTCDISGKVVSTHSPVELHIYDELGNHTGPNENGDIGYGIPGVQYDVLDDVNYVFLPDGKDYKVVTKATDTGGFNLKIEEQNSDDVIIKTHDWTLVPIESLFSTSEVWVGPDYTNDSYKLKVDNDGDGNIDDNYEEGFDGTSIAEKVTKKEDKKEKTRNSVISGSIPKKEKNDNWGGHNFIDNIKIPKLSNLKVEDSKIKNQNKNQEIAKEDNSKKDIQKDKDIKNRLLASAGSIDNINNRTKLQIIVVGAFALLLLSLKFVFKVI